MNTCFTNAKLIKSFRDRLENIFEKDAGLAKNLFWYGNRIISEESQPLLMNTPFLESTRHGVYSTHQVWNDDGMFIITDRLDYQPLDRVFPVFSDESLFLTRSILTKRWHKVLDIGTGSGILAIHAARKGANVRAIDISNRALETAKMNAKINNVQNRIIFELGDTFATINQDEHFDLIISNPPFVPIPTNCPFHLAGAGGREGIDVVSKILRGASHFINKGSTLAILSLSLSRGNNPYILDLVSEYISPNVPFRLIRVYDRSVPLLRYCQVFERWDKNQLWYASLSGKGFTDFLYVLLLVGHNVDALIQSLPITKPELTSYSGSWSRRFARYRYWLDGYGL